MRFQKMARHTYVATPRKSAAILRRQRKDREALPLFADQIAAEQLPVEDVHAMRARAWTESEREGRAQQARDWQRARAALRQIEPPEARVRLLDFWNRHRWFPATPSYLLSMLHMWRHDRLDLDAPGMLIPRRAPLS